MMMGYAEARRLKRWMLPVPVLTPRLSSYWVNLVTPIPAAIARPLIEGLRTESIVHDPIARQLFAHIQPVNYRVSVERALAQLEPGRIESTWIGSSSTLQDGSPLTVSVHEGMIVEHQRRVIPAPSEAVYPVFTGLGGKRGWFNLTWAWRARAILDRLLGGVGFRRGRRDPDELQVGDALDSWRVEALEPGAMLRLRSEMKLPGTAWLQWRVIPREAGKVLLVQTTFFAPRGLPGWLYWYAAYPLHKWMFRTLIDQVAKQALTRAT
jgi:hypothetical protein